VGTCVSLFLSALELAGVSTALPTIVSDLRGPNFIWIGSAYAVASSASIPASGGLANIYGRRDILLGSIAFFAAGSAVAGAAQSINMLIAGRSMCSLPCLFLKLLNFVLVAVQGIGAGGIVALTEIIVADLVPLRERGKFGALLGIVRAVNMNMRNSQLSRSFRSGL